MPKTLKQLRAEATAAYYGNDEAKFFAAKRAYGKAEEKSLRGI